MAILPALLNRLAERVAEQEIADGVALHRRAWQRVGLPFTAEDAAASAAFWRAHRTRPTGLGLEGEIQWAAQWWADRLGLSAEEIITEAERIVEEHDKNGCSGYGLADGEPCEFCEICQFHG